VLLEIEAGSDNLNSELNILRPGFEELAQAGGYSRSVVWGGKPWIVPGVIARTVVVFIVAVAVFWLELAYNVGGKISGYPVLQYLSAQLVLWTALVFLLIWALSLLHLVLLRAASTYVLREDSLELRHGILTSKSEMISPSGFSDLEVVRSISDRILNSGKILIRTQSEDERALVMTRVHDPMSVAARIREVMSRPIVRIEGQGQVGQKK
jgi:uncharacterized membrane protein YdbT with pleckstrin-like domain